MKKLQKMKFFDRFRKNRRFFQKAQAAMEFLMSYGWAILVVLVAIGTISYFGVGQGQAAFLPERCIIDRGSGLICEEFSASIGIIILRVRNILADPIEITGASISQGANSCNLTSIEPPGPIAADRSANLILSAGPTCLDLTMPGTKLKGDISITFTRKSLSRTATGDTLVEIGAAPEGVSQEICNNAQTYGLCDGLDIVFGGGYRDACCSVYYVCCPPA